jgi:uncharacterized protein YgiM (DUF1202 family)
MNKLPMLILASAFLLTSCLQTTITEEPADERVFPLTPEPAEIASGAVFELTETPAADSDMCAQVSAIVAVNLRHEPSAERGIQIIRALTHGELVTIHKQIAGWSAVTTSQGEDGYVKAEYLTESECE